MSYSHKKLWMQRRKKSSINDFINHAGHFQQALYICLYTNLHNINLREEIKGSVRRMRREIKFILEGCKKISSFFEKENMEKFMLQFMGKILFHKLEPLKICQVKETL